MIYLQEIAEKLNQILNEQIERVDLQFVVQTEGFHIDHIYDLKTKRNFIPVFISRLGGTINAVPALKHVNVNVPVAIYFPVRFKEDMEVLFEELIDIFTGQILEYGKSKKKALSNLSVPTYGEIQNVDFAQFRKWVGDNYGQLPIEVMEPYLSLTFTLYLQSSGSEFVYGNQVKITNVTITQGETTILNDDSPVMIERIDMESSESAAQQLFTETHAKGYPANSAYTKQLPLIMKNDSQYKDLIDIIEVDKNPQSLIITLTEEIPFVDEQGDADPLSVSTDYYITNYSRKVSLGELVGIQLTLSVRGDVE